MGKIRMNRQGRAEWLTLGLTVLVLATPAGSAAAEDLLIPMAEPWGSSSWYGLENQNGLDDVTHKYYKRGATPWAGEAYDAPTYTPTGELRIWLPFDLTDDQRAAIADASEIRFHWTYARVDPTPGVGRADMSNMPLDLWGFQNLAEDDNNPSDDENFYGDPGPGDTWTVTKVVDDWVTNDTPQNDLNGFETDVTAFVKAEAARGSGYDVIFRGQIDPPSLPIDNDYKECYRFYDVRDASGNPNFYLVVVPPTLQLGDVNGDGVVDGLDIQPFVDLLTGGGYQAEADINADSVVDGLDIQPFVDIITGAGGNPVPEPASMVMLALGGLAALRKRHHRRWTR